jgi:hypothetical protein
MRYLTHQFASLETLERARRWLIHAGFDPSQIEAMTDGIPRIAVRLGPGQAAEAELVIDAVELTDPKGNPSFWDLARQKHIYPKAASPTEYLAAATDPSTFTIGYHSQAERLQDMVSTIQQTELDEGYLRRGD